VTMAEKLQKWRWKGREVGRYEEVDVWESSFF
jgi:hypothetical protein